MTHRSTHKQKVTELTHTNKYTNPNIFTINPYIYKSKYIYDKPIYQNFIDTIPK